jgi:GNAT superfamily N-acetyltransferase
MGKYVALLEVAQHDVNKFDCGEAPLNQWLQSTAARHQSKKGGRSSATYVLVDDSDPTTIIGFVTLAIRQLVVTEELPPQLAKKLPNQVPGLTLARLGVDKDHQGQGHGEFLLFEAIAIAKTAMSTVGGYALFVDAKPGKASFYQKYGFIPYPQDPDTLFLPYAAM